MFRLGGSGSGDVFGQPVCDHLNGKAKAVLADGFSPVSTFDAGSSCLKSWVTRLRRRLLKLYGIAGLGFLIGVT